MSDNIRAVAEKKADAKIEFYTGDEVSAENVKTLLNIAKNSLGSYEITPIQDPEHPDETDPDKIQYNFKLKIERNKVDETGTNQILEKIGEKNKYKVSIFYKEQNKLIDYITIEDVSK